VTVLVTGGSGLVGSHVIAALRAAGRPVRALVRERATAAVTALDAEPVLGDVTDEAAWRRAAAGVQGIVHAAALVQARAAYAEYERVNVGGTRLAVAAARAAGAPLVHISSVAVYGGSAVYGTEPERRDESYPFQPIEPADTYARTKRQSEELVREAGRDGAVAAIALRPNVIYGERDRLFTPLVMLAARLGFGPSFGPGTNHLSCVYAGNVAAAVLAALGAARPGFRAYNVTNDAPPPLVERDFVTAFGEALGKRVRRVRLPRVVLRAFMTLLRGPRLGRASVAFLTGENPYVSDLIRRELSWEPPFRTADAVRRTVAGWR
jgi:nucleoside-diphosphate-sugar epimerase